MVAKRPVHSGPYDRGANAISGSENTVCRAQTAGRTVPLPVAVSSEHARPNIRSDGTSRATDRPAAPMTISSPLRTRRSSREKCVLVSYTFTAAPRPSL
jgi:hypothetical protein